MYYDSQSYGESWADSYDQHFPNPVEGSLDRLRELAGAGPVLELGPGTGRLAGPLSAGGLTVHGVEASEQMLKRLRERWGNDVKIVGNDFSEFQTEENRYSLVFVAFNTFFALLTQEDQVSCMECVSTTLEPGGRFLLELFVPDPGRFDRGQRLATIGVEESSCRVEAARHNSVDQTVESQIMTFTESGVDLKPIKVRYAWPAELDLMARLAGLQRVHRWGGWLKQPFTSDSNLHVSVYQKPLTPPL